MSHLTNTGGVLSEAASIISIAACEIGLKYGTEKRAPGCVSIGIFDESGFRIFDFCIYIKELEAKIIKYDASSHKNYREIDGICHIDDLHEHFKSVAQQCGHIV